MPFWLVTMGPQNQCVPDGEVGVECNPALSLGLTGHETNTFTAMAWVKPDGIQPNYTGIVLGHATFSGPTTNWRTIGLVGLGGGAVTDYVR